MVRMGVLSGFLGTMVLGGFMALSGAIAVGSFSVLLFLTQRFLWPFTRLGEIVDLFSRSMASTERIMNLINTNSMIIGILFNFIKIVALDQISNKGTR